MKWVQGLLGDVPPIVPLHKCSAFTTPKRSATEHTTKQHITMPLYWLFFPLRVPVYICSILIIVLMLTSCNWSLISMINMRMVVTFTFAALMEEPLLTTLVSIGIIQ